ncbi:MAG: FtsW/RodA/SpoVE family cell cycle protein [Anaerolineales bacterium]
MSDTALTRPTSSQSGTQRRMFALDFDIYLFLAMAVLCAMGFLMVYSASISPSFLATEDATTTYFFRLHVRNFVIGFMVMALLVMIDYRVWKRFSLWIMLGTILTLVIVLQFGEQRLAAQRSLFEGSVQPGEFAKLAVVIYMAAWLASRQRQLKNISYGLLPFGILVGLTCFLLVLQPDLSTAATILATSLTLFFLAGADWLQLGLLAGGAGGLGYMLITRLPYAQSRIADHLAAIQDLTQANEHVQAAVEAFLNGQLFGVGLGEGTQKFGRLPFPHTDSIFAVIGEELGLMGSFLVLSLFVVLVYRGFVVARNAPDLFGALVSSGVVLWIAYDAILNIAVMTALVPPTGVPLPFISFGGSSLVTAMAGVGLVLSVSRQAARTPPERAERPVALPLDARLAEQPEASATPSEAEKENARETPAVSGRYRRGHISRVSRRQRDT